MSTDPTVQGARDASRDVLLEHEGLALVRGLGINTPHHVLVPNAHTVDGELLESFAGDKIVIKVSSPEILHKSDVGGVKVVDRKVNVVQAAIREMALAFDGTPVEGFLLMAFVPFQPSLGHELLLGMRWTDDFGPVVSLSLGGIYTEFLNANLRPGAGVTVVSPVVASDDAVDAALGDKVFTPLLFGGLRGQPALVDRDVVRALLQRALAFADEHMPHDVRELEMNPIVVHEGQLVALDVLAKLGDGTPVTAPDRPTDKIMRLLRPSSAAVIGVSDKPNPGHIIVKNLLREGFPSDKLWVVKPGRESFAGCACVPELKALPERVDLLVLSISADQAPAALEEVIAHRLAETVILIPGGVGETEASKPILYRMEAALAESRASEWRGPVINGGNCLGIRSKPGHYDTMFIPEYKLPPTSGPVAPLAFISQSGALAVARASKLASLNPRYILSIGNQMDLTAGDYLEALSADDEVEVFACYVEGFKPLDGQKWLRAAEGIVASGRTVILYRAGRTAAGKKASASHTASVAGDYTVTRALAEQAGVVVADTLSDFEDLIRAFTLMRDKTVSGTRLGAISNAGFECVGFADNLETLTLDPYSSALHATLEELVEAYRLKGIVEVHNPMDLTPMLGDKGYDAIVGAILDDDAVDVGIVGIVPLTPALQSLPKSDQHREDLFVDKGVVARLAQRYAASAKPWVVVIDGGEDYDPMAYALEARGVPTFRTADRAARALEAFVRQQR